MHQVVYMSLCMIMFPFVGCTSTPHIPPDLPELLAQYEAHCKQQESVAPTVAMPNQVLQRSNRTGLGEMLVEYKLPTEPLGFDKDALELPVEPEDEIVENLKQWYGKMKVDLEQSGTAGKQIKISAAPRKLRLDAWKIKIKKLLKHPIQIIVSKNEVKASYRIPWPAR